jgi:hypothetical protein
MRGFLLPVDGGFIVRDPCSSSVLLVDDGLTEISAEFTLPSIIDASARGGRVALLSADGPTAYLLDRGERRWRTAAIGGMEGGREPSLVAVGDDEVWAVTAHTVGIFPESEEVVGRLRRLPFSDFTLADA